LNKENGSESALPEVEARMFKAALGRANIFIDKLTKLEFYTCYK